MIGRLAALILLSTLSHSSDIQIPLTVAKLGDSLTLTCSVSADDAGLFYWYKLRFGYMVETIAGGSLYKLLLRGPFKNSRFTVTPGGDLNFLHIKNISKEDEATYFCQAGAAYDMRVNNATVLVVNDHKNQQNSVYVRQIPETASVQPGDSVALQCSLLSKKEENSVQCPGEHSVYWFRAGSEGFHPSVVYTHRDSTDQQEKRSCVYSLSKTIQSSSDTGTYYCAVVTCGEILFGEGTEVQTKQERFPFVIVLGTLLACCVIMIVALIIFLIKKTDCEHCKASTCAEQDRSAGDERNNVEGEEASLNYVALDFSSRKRERRTYNRDFPQDSVYSGMRDCQRRADAMMNEC